MTPARAKYVDSTAILDCSPRFLQGARPWCETEAEFNRPVALPEFVYVGPFAVIGCGALLGSGCVVDAYCRIEPLAQLGEDSLVLYRGTIGMQAVVGKRCVIGGSVSERTVVEDDCTSFGKLIHTHWDSRSPWDDREEPEPSPVIRRRSFIGHDALVIGGIEVGPHAYVCAGATLTCTLLPYHIAYGVNKIVHYSQWRGKLAQNPLFLTDQ
ncbi:MAG: hypothetical protein J5J06_07580 [Phycisphaerae bacterium]|nr:hypothetical protein [Phycisphaerae bacterium]